MTEDCFHLGVKALIRNESGNFLLVQINKARHHQATEAYWDIPGGRIQKDETLEQALRREVFEEIGVTGLTNIKPLNMVLSNIRIPLPNNKDVGLVLAIYTCDIPPGSTIRLSGEHVATEWVAAAEAAKRLGVKYPAELTQQLATL